jgi:hypothetical protein
MTDRSHENPQDLHSRPRCLNLHSGGPLGVCRRFADRSLSVSVIEGLPVRLTFMISDRPER